MVKLLLLISEKTRQVYNLFQNLWNNFLGFFRKVFIKKKPFSKFYPKKVIQIGGVKLSTQISHVKSRLQSNLKGKLPTRSFSAYRGKFFGVVGGRGGGGVKNVEPFLKTLL